MTGDSFSTKLLGKPSHESLIKLQDQEIKFLEVVKKTIIERIKCEKEYSKALIHVATIAGKVESTDHNSPLLDTWQCMVRNINSLGQTIKNRANELQSDTLDKVVTLIKDKQTLKKTYETNRERIDEKLTRILLHDLEEKKNQYVKLEQSTAAAHKNLDNMFSKGKQKPAEQAGDKFRRCTMNLHDAHNKYVLQVMEASHHQHYYRNQILPELLFNLGYMESECAKSVQEIFSEFVTTLSPCKEEIVSDHTSTESMIKSLNSDTEYESFVEIKSSSLENEATIQFETQEVLRGEATNLHENQIELNRLTLQSIENQKQTFKEDIAVVTSRLDDTGDKLQILHTDINQIHENIDHIRRSRILTSHLRLIEKKMEYINLKFSHTEDSVLKEKLQQQLELLLQSQNDLGDKDPPPGLKLPSFDTLSQTSTNENQKTNQMFSIVKKGFNTFKQDIKKIVIQEKYKIFDVNRPINEHEWYHGNQTRQEALEQLRLDGDFLLRHSANSYVLSAKHNNQTKHFKVQETPEHQYKFESKCCQTVVELIEFHYENRVPITRQSECVLKNPVPKDKWQLSRSDIQLQEVLGNGNFGEVRKAILKTKNIQVAVKTCRESVDPNTRDKFLMEARILKGYDHPNIVKLIGVCTDEQPVYIVMELVPGGDLHKYLKNQNAGTVAQKQLMRMCHDACSGLEYLEKRKCIHRDVAARNCLLTQTKVVKITDFGMSREEEDGIYNVSGSMKQIPIKWTAPEALNYGQYTSASDVWSFGVLSWEIFSFCKTPYTNMLNGQVRDQVERGYRMERPTHCPVSYYNDVMKRCWEYNADDRPKFYELCRSIKSML